MESRTPFDLNEAIRRWQENLAASPALSADNLEELASHVRASVQKLQADGLSKEEAFLAATRRLGGRGALEREFGKVAAATSSHPMKIYWSLRNVPELAPLAPVDRKRVHEACLQRYVWGAPATRRSLLAYVMVFIVALVFVSLTTWLVQVLGGSTPTWLMFLPLATGMMLGHFVFSRMSVSHLRQFYPDFIQKELRHDVL